MAQHKSYIVEDCQYLFCMWLSCSSIGKCLSALLSFLCSNW